jgi:two-component system sensor histidine kinase RegB
MPTPTSAQPSQLPNATDSVVNLQRLSVIRGVALGGQLLALWYFTRLQPLGLPTAQLALLLGGYAAVWLQGWWRAAGAKAIGEREFFAYLMLDTLFFTLLFYFSGGASNPFISYYLIPITIAATTLPMRLSAILTAVALAAYSVLLEYNIAVPALSAAAQSGHGHHGGAGNLHVVGMWVNFALSATIICYFISRMAATVRQQQQRLERQRADQLRSDQLTAIGLLAAGTAHEFGTPLNTMKIVLDDLKGASANTAEPADIALLSDQVAHCQTILRSLVETARQATESQPEPVPVATHIAKLAERWQLLRPTAQLLFDNQLDGALRATIHPSIGQALINLLNNAADASDRPVELTAACRDQTLTVTVRDHATVNEPTGDSDGLGIGLSLSAASVERFGGQLSLAAHPHGGSVATMSLPLGSAIP